MFEAAELGQVVSKQAFEEAKPQLRQQLLEAQGRLRGADFPVILLFAGVDGAGKSETADLLNRWMDPRLMVTRAYDEPTQEERERPRYWRYWRGLPPRGRIGIFLSAWYHDPLLERVYGKLDERGFDDALEQIRSLERMLADDGALILKFWMHLGHKQQRKRLKSLAADPLQSWRVTERDWEHWRMYDKFVLAAERLITRTSTGFAPWNIVEGTDARFRSLEVTRLLLKTLSHRLTEKRPAPPPPPDPPAEKSGVTVLSKLDMTLSLDRAEYKQRLQELQARLNRLQREAWRKKKSAILIFQGWDAAGKGGAIHRITAALDSRNYEVISIAAPTDEERAHHYLWRFWRHLPRAGRVTIFDRSWYGRVLVERVEGFATEPEWRRAYAEINEFEDQLVAHGIVLVKFWLHITPEEQEQRFRAREQTPYKRWKLGDEDWRNRSKWGLYEQAMQTMIERTSTQVAPWILVEANDKRYARIKVLENVCEALERGLARRTGSKSGRK